LKSNNRKVSKASNAFAVLMPVILCTMIVIAQ